MILAAVNQPIASCSQESIELYAVVFRVTDMASGIYRGMKLLKAGDFSAKVAYLCVDQRVAGDGAVTWFLAANGQNYQTVSQLAGLVGQRVYLASQYHAMACTGIGAYYDDETKAFLDTEKDILYVLAVGR